MLVIFIQFYTIIINYNSIGTIGENQNLQGIQTFVMLKIAFLFLNHLWFYFLNVSSWGFSVNTEEMFKRLKRTSTNK